MAHAAQHACDRRSGFLSARRARRRAGQVRRALLLRFAFAARPRSWAVADARSARRRVGAGARHRTHRADLHGVHDVQRSVFPRAPLPVARSDERRQGGLERGHHLQSGRGREFRPGGVAERGRALRPRGRVHRRDDQAVGKLGRARARRRCGERRVRRSRAGPAHRSSRPALRHRRAAERAAQPAGAAAARAGRRVRSRPRTGGEACGHGVYVAAFARRRAALLRGSQVESARERKGSRSIRNIAGVVSGHRLDDGRGACEEGRNGRVARSGRRHRDARAPVRHPAGGPRARRAAALRADRARRGTMCRTASPRR